MSKTVRELETKLKQQQRRLELLKKDRSARRDDLNKTYVAPLEQKVRDERERIELLLQDEFPAEEREAMQETIRAIERELNAAKAEAASGNPLIGQQFRRWYCRNVNGTWFSTDELAMVSVYDGRNISKFRGWTSPRVGELFFQNVKKDGKPGVLSYGRLDGGQIPHGWFPAGVNPNETKEK